VFSNIEKYAELIFASREQQVSEIMEMRDILEQYPDSPRSRQMFDYLRFRAGLTGDDQEVLDHLTAKIMELYPH